MERDSEPQTSRGSGEEVFTSRRRKYAPREWAKARGQKATMATFRPFELWLDPASEERLRAASSPQLIPLGDGAPPEKAAAPSGPQPVLKRATNPAPRASLGFAGPVVRVESGQRFFQCLLAFPVDGGRTEGLARETIRVFRWRECDEAFELVEPGGLEDGLAWARISSPGLYTVIGLSADPFKQTLIKVTSAMAPAMAGMGQRNRDALLRRVGKALASRAWFRSFGPEAMQSLFHSGWLPSPGAGFGFGGFPDFPEGGRGWPGWEPDICPPMPRKGWPEYWLIPIIEGFRHRLLENGWVHRGPTNLPGHSTEIVIDPGDHNRIYTTTANGGLWVLDDVSRYPGGSTWRPLTDSEDDLTTQCMAVAPSDNRILYYADAASRLFRSDDRGVSWAPTRAATFDLANRILVDPTDADTVYIATEGGFFRSDNAGADWDTLFTGAVVDAVWDHQDNRVIYLGVRNVGLLKTTTHGTGPSAWATVLPWSGANSPAGTEIRLAIGRQRTATTRTVVVRFDQEVFVNRNGGVATAGADGWSSKGKVGGDGYGWWCFALGVSPHDDRVILAGSQDLYRTATGAAPWTKVGGYGTDVHPDFWDITFDPTTPDLVYCANDGGIYRSIDSGATWQSLDHRLTTAQLFATGVSGDGAVGGMYHQGIVASSSLSTGQWQTIEGGAWEFSKVCGDPKRPYYFYVLGSKLHRRRWPDAATGKSFNLDWGNFTVTSIGVDGRAGSGVILCGASGPSALKRTLMADSAMPTWTDETIALTAGEVVASVAFAPSQPATAYVITSQGNVFRKKDVASASAWTLVSSWTGRAAIGLAVDPNDSERLYAITPSTIGMLDLAGPGWTTITGTSPDALPSSSPYREVLAHPTVSGVLIVALEIGVFITEDNGKTWRNYDNSEGPGAALPNAPIQDINWSGGALYAVCHGRGLWAREVRL